MNPVTLRTMLSCVVAVTAAAPAAAQRIRGPGLGARVDSLVERYRTGRQVPGIAIAVVRNGTVIKAKGYGFANLELKAPVTPETVFGLGSISKQFTATAIMQLVEDGKVRLDDPITRYIDSLPPHWGRMTVRHLLTHTSGIPEERFLPNYIEFDRAEHHHLDVLRTVFADSLQSAPGAVYAYRNSGYRLLGMIVEKASGESYWTFMERRIFAPLGMRATRSSDPKSLIPHRAKGYGKERGRVVNRDAVTETAAFSEGALMSSVLDLARWDSSLYHPRVLSQASLDQMWTPVTLTDGKSHPYGFGWFVPPTNGLRTVGHGGTLPGFFTNISRFVAKGLTVVVLGNAEWANPAALAQAIAGMYEPELAPQPPAPIADADPEFSAEIRTLADGLGRGELDLSRLAPDARDEWSAEAVKRAAALLRRGGRIQRFELVERFGRGELAWRRYWIAMDRGALLLAVQTQGKGPLRSLTLEESLASR